MCLLGVFILFIYLFFEDGDHGVLPVEQTNDEKDPDAVQDAVQSGSSSSDSDSSEDDSDDDDDRQKMKSSVAQVSVSASYYCRITTVLNDATRHIPHAFIIYRNIELVYWHPGWDASCPGVFDLNLCTNV